MAAPTSLTVPSAGVIETTLSPRKYQEDLKMDALQKVCQIFPSSKPFQACKSREAKPTIEKVIKIWSALCDSSEEIPLPEIRDKVSVNYNMVVDFQDKVSDAEQLVKYFLKEFRAPVRAVLEAVDEMVKRCKIAIAIQENQAFLNVGCTAQAGIQHTRAALKDPCIFRLSDLFVRLFSSQEKNQSDKLRRLLGNELSWLTREVIVLQGNKEKIKQRTLSTENGLELEKVRTQLFSLRFQIVEAQNQFKNHHRITGELIGSKGWLYDAMGAPQSPTMWLISMIRCMDDQEWGQLKRKYASRENPLLSDKALDQLRKHPWEIRNALLPELLEFLEELDNGAVLDINAVAGITGVAGIAASGGNRSCRSCFVDDGLLQLRQITEKKTPPEDIESITLDELRYVNTLIDICVLFQAVEDAWKKAMEKFPKIPEKNGGSVQAEKQETPSGNPPQQENKTKNLHPQTDSTGKDFSQTILIRRSSSRKLSDVFIDKSGEAEEMIPLVHMYLISMDKCIKALQEFKENALFQKFSTTGKYQNNYSCIYKELRKILSQSITQTDAIKEILRDFLGTKWETDKMSC